MLDVAGDSMTGAAISDGDRVVVRCQACAENGEIVAAMVESGTSADFEATVIECEQNSLHPAVIDRDRWSKGAGRQFCSRENASASAVKHN